MFSEFVEEVKPEFSSRIQRDLFFKLEVLFVRQNNLRSCWIVDWVISNKYFRFMAGKIILLVP